MFQCLVAVIQSNMHLTLSLFLCRKSRDSGGQNIAALEQTVMTNDKFNNFAMKDI